MQKKFIFFTKLMFITFMILGLGYNLLSRKADLSYSVGGGYVWLIVIFIFLTIQTIGVEKENERNILQKGVDYAVIVLLAIFLILYLI